MLHFLVHPISPSVVCLAYPITKILGTTMHALAPWIPPTLLPFKRMLILAEP